MALKDEIQSMKTIEQGVANNKVVNFAYTNKAYTDNDVNGVDVYDFNNDNNIPTNNPDVIKVNPTVITKGYRAQASSITRMLVNHIFGRVSYNLNKTTDLFTSLLDKLGNAIGEPNGIATLDADGRIPYSQLPESAVEYKGEWNAETNTPTLVDGTGDKGDMYYVSTAGTQNLGSGDIVFLAGDRIIYNGSIWQRLSEGSVKSVNNIRPDDTGNVNIEIEGSVKSVNNISPDSTGNVQLTGENIQVSITDDTLLSKFKLRDIFSPLLGRFWTQSNITSGRFDIVTYANGIWVAGGYNKGLYYSQDGMTWTQSNITRGDFNIVTYANGIWIAGSSSNGLYYSQDGMTWTQSNITSGNIRIVTYANGIWIAGSSSGKGLYYSQDGITWTQSNITSGRFNIVTYANGIWIAGSNGSNKSYKKGLYYSQDGMTWTQSNITSGDFDIVTYANGIWIAGSSSSSKGSYYSDINTLIKNGWLVLSE